MEYQPARQDGCQGSREIRASKPAMKVMSRICLSRDLSHHSRAQAPGILHLLQICCLIKMMQHFCWLCHRISITKKPHFPPGNPGASHLPQGERERGSWECLIHGERLEQGNAAARGHGAPEEHFMGLRSRCIIGWGRKY